MATQREVSRQEWNATPTIEEINSGSLQRIADATEKMASNYVAIERDRDRYREWYAATRKREDSANRRIAALKGVITKLKKARNA